MYFKTYPRVLEEHSLRQVEELSYWGQIRFKVMQGGHTFWDSEYNIHRIRFHMTTEVSVLLNHIFPGKADKFCYVFCEEN